MSGTHSHHQHSHGGGARATSPARRRALVIALVLNAAFLVIEFTGGIVFNSLALVSDAVHQFSDVVALGIALGALVMADRPPTARNTYGWKRAEVLAALGNGVALIAISVWIVVEAIDRFGSPDDANGTAMIVLGLAGLVVNAGSAYVVVRVSGGNLNLRAAFLHLASDALGSLAAVVAGIVILATGSTWADPAASILIAVLIVLATLQLVRDATGVLLEAAPRGLDSDAVTVSLETAPGVAQVHHLHLWSIGSEEAALSAHVVLEEAESLHAAQEQGDALKALLAARFGIDHATLELECHTCEDDHHHA